MGHFWIRKLLENVVCLLKKTGQNRDSRRTQTTELTEMTFTIDLQLKIINSHSYEAD
jgi:hypothetical protein